MRQSILIFSLVLLSSPAFADGVKKVGSAGGDSTLTDGIGNGETLSTILGMQYPGNIDRTGMMPLYVSCQEGGAYPLGTDLVCDSTEGFGVIVPCTSDGQCVGSCDTLNPKGSAELPFLSISAAQKMYASNGCGQDIRLDSGDYFYNECIGTTANNDQGFTPGPLTCVDTTNTRLGLMFGPWPDTSIKVPINFAIQDNVTQTPTVAGLPAIDTATGRYDLNTDADYVLVADVTGSSTVITDASITMGVNDLQGFQITVTGTCAGLTVLGKTMDVISNTATTVTTNTWGGVVDGCTFTGVAVGGTADGGTVTLFEHFTCAGQDDGLCIFANLDVYNPWEANVFSQSQKDPGTSMLLFGIHMHPELTSDDSPQYAIHNNSPATDYIINTVIETAARPVINTSGNGVYIGNHFYTNAEWDADDYLVLMTSDVNLMIANVFDAGNDTTNDRTAVRLGTNAAVANEWTSIFNLYTGGSIGGGGTGSAGIDLNTGNSSSPTSWIFRSFFDAFVYNDVAIRLNQNTAHTYSKSIFIRGAILSEFNNNSILLSGISGSFDDTDYDIQDTCGQFDTPTNHWDMETPNLGNVAAARADLIANSPGITCGGSACVATPGNIDTFFFGNSDDLGSREHNEHNTAGNIDRVRLGGAHDNTTACYKQSTYSIDVTVDDKLKLLKEILPSGELVNRWQFNEDGLTRDRGPF